jgi:hypothetical protein
MKLPTPACDRASIGAIGPTGTVKDDVEAALSVVKGEAALPVRELIHG